METLVARGHGIALLPRHTTRETFELTMHAHGVLENTSEPSGIVPEVGAPAA